MKRRFIDRDLEALFAASDQISLFAWENSPGWPVVYSTANAQRLLGYTAEDFIERRVRFLDKVHPADRVRVSKEIEDAIADRNARSFTHSDYRMIRADGEVIWVSDTTVIERNRDWQVEYLLGYLLDITSRKQLELSIQAERKYLNQVIDGARLSSWTWDCVTGQVRVNEHWLALVGDPDGQSHFSASQWLSWIHPEDRARRERAIRDHIAGVTEFYEAIYRIKTFEQNTLYVLDRGQAVNRNEHGDVTQVSGILTDITLHKEAELAAQRSAEVRTRILANVSHEVRTPLHGILGLASVLAREVANPEHQRMLRTIQDSGAYLLTALNDVLDLTRAEYGQIEVNIGVHDLKSIAQHIRDLFTERARGKGLLFVCDLLPDAPPRAMIDRARVLQVMINLVDNAIKYTDDGYVKVYLDWSSKQVDSELIIRVEDSGRGIRDIERVWDLFVQEPTSADSSSGSGVGLNVVKNLIEALAGRVEVESGVAQGSVFTVYLPSVAAQAQEVDAENMPAVTVKKSYRALIVDDSDVNQLVLGQMLERLGVEFVSVSSGEAALEFLRAHKADIVFMDVRMDGMTGIETTQAIRQDFEDSLYIVGLTAHALIEVEQECRNSGMNECLNKPFLMSDIREVLEHYEARVLE